jgi:lambda family phage tail tape measure protein
MGTEAERLVLQVDAAIELARRNLRELTGVVNTETTKWEDKLNNSGKAVDRLGNRLKSVGQFRGGMQQLSFQIGDVSQQLSLGVKTSTIFAQQSGQVIQALMLMNTGGSGFLKFLAGPWGVVLTTAGVILASFAGKLFDTGNEVGKLVDKMRDQARQADLNRKADEAWKQTVEGLTEAIRKRREEQEKSLKTDIQTERQSLDQAKRELDDARAKLGQRVRDQAAAEAELSAAKTARNSATERAEMPAAFQRVTDAQAKLERIKSDIKTINGDIAKAEASVRGAEIPISERRVEGRLDAVVAATNRYTEALGRLREERTKGLISQAEYEKRLESEKRKLKAAEDAARDKNKADADAVNFINPVGGGTITGTFGEKRPGHAHAGIDIATAVGTNVQAAAPGTVIEVGNLPGYGNVVIIDHGRGTTTRYAHLSKLLAAKGDQVGQGAVIGLSGGARGAPGAGNSQGPHLHFEVRRGGRPVDPRKGPFPVDPELAGRGAIASAARAVDKANDQDNEFRAQSERLDQQLLAAQAELVQGTEARAVFAEKQIDADEREYENSLDKAVDDGRLRKQQADLLVEKSRSVVAQRKANIEARKSVELLEQQNRAAQQQTEFQVDALRYADEVARTSEEHRRLQLEIIDILYKQKEADLKIALAKAKQAKDAEETARIQAQLAELPAQRARETDRANRGTMNPLEQWADQVPHTAADINQALMQIEAQGLDSLADGIAGVISGTQSLGDAFRSIAAGIVADIARMIARMIIMRALMSALGGVGGGAAGAGASAAFDFGASGGYDAVNAGLVGMASGGFVSGPGSPTSDSIPAMLSNGEYVMNSAAVSRFGLPFLEAINSGRMPHAKGGGLMGLLGGGLFGLFRGGLGDFALPGSGAWLAKKIGPAGLLGKVLHFSDGGPVHAMPRFAMPMGPNVAMPRSAATSEARSGDKYFNIYVTAPNSGDAVRDRASSLQHAQAVRREVSRAIQASK